jgi:superfamily I DNA and/or RNA helicase/very-short-patch-repair endonuclease
MEQVSLLNFIKYCLGYVKLTRQRSFILQSKLAIKLPEYFFNLAELLESDIDENAGKLINLETFYSLDPKKITKETQKQYTEEQSIAKKIEEIYNKGRNDPYTKQIFFSFGYYGVEIPVGEEEIELRSDYLGEENENEKPATKIDRYPLFSLPISIEKVFEKGAGKYFIKPIDTEVQVNIGILADILGEDLYYKLIEEFGRYEVKGDLSLPITNMAIFNEIWDKIRAQLKLTDAKFSEESFVLNEMRVGISPKVNYFIADDLQKLSKYKEDDFKNTSLISWIGDENLSSKDEIPEEGELYFPFLYDEYQLRVLSNINNNASIVQGPPGTGKSQTIANLLCHLAAKGKKVLFVSQKEQALKVVKDMLKKIGTRYLFGYMPDVGSIQLNEEDRLDGIAPQLAALESHIDELGYKIYPRRKYPLIVYKEEKGSSITEKSIKNIIEKKIELRQLFDQSIEAQRLFYKLYQELEDLKEYDFEVSNPRLFQSTFSNDLRKKIIELKNGMERLGKEVRNYEKNKKKAEFDKLFSTLDLKNNHYSELVRKIIDDIAKGGYDGHNKIFRSLRNTLQKLRLKNVRFVLPRELLDFIDDQLEQDISKIQAIKTMEELLNYCRYHEQQQELEEMESGLEDSLDSSGLSNKEFLQIEKLISKANFNEVKEKILRASEIHSQLNEIKIENPNDISLSLDDAEKTRQQRIAKYLQNIINKKILDKYKEGTSVRAIVRKLAKAFGKSKKAYRTFDRLRDNPDNFLAIMDFIPIWIMELDDASRIIPLEPGIFDYVIFDESSQCNIAYGIPAMYRAKKALFVGDSEQMRDDTIIFKSNRSFDELAKKYQISEDLQIKATGEAVQSILDIARLRGFEEVPLRNHYRSPKELIGFSNKYFYKPKGKELIIQNTNYLAYKNTNQIMVIHPVEVDWDKEVSERISVSEAKNILDFFRELKSDKRYQDKSIGILSFFNAQAAYLRELFEKEGYKEEVNNYKIGIIEGIQGDEKDIIIYSFVIRNPDQKNKYIPLTGEGGDIRVGINKGRVNVAFSRARLQTHCFVSMPIEKIPNGIWIKKYLEYVDENGKIDFFSVELKPFDSEFEKVFYNFICSNLSKKVYRIQNQVRSCGFKIDFIITNVKTGKKIAVECDGPTHFQDEAAEEIGIYIEDDEERQRVLEAAGWEFYRIKYSDWIDEKFDRNQILDEIVKCLS